MTDRAIYDYEVELLFVNQNTKKRTTVTRREHAYSVGDAVQQALFSSMLDAGSSDITVVRVGPPQEVILRAVNPAQIDIKPMLDNLERELGKRRK